MPMKAKVNKSAAIRELLSKMGLDASPSEVARRLKARGIMVSPDAVSTMKLEMRKRAAANSNTRQVTASAQSPSTKTSIQAANGHVDINDVFLIRTLAKKVGAENMHRLVDAVAS